MSTLTPPPTRDRHRPVRGPRSSTERSLVVLEVLLAVGAVAGALGLLTGGIDLGATVQRLPFASTVFAGVALLLVNGLLPVVVVAGAMQDRPWAPFGHLAVGIALTAWIVVQVAFTGWPPVALQWIYLGYGLVVTALALRVRRSR